MVNLGSCVYMRIAAHLYPSRPPLLLRTTGTCVASRACMRMMRPICIKRLACGLSHWPRGVQSAKRAGPVQMQLLRVRIAHGASPVQMQVLCVRIAMQGRGAQLALPRVRAVLRGSTAPAVVECRSPRVCFSSRAPGEVLGVRTRQAPHRSILCARSVRWACTAD